MTFLTWDNQEDADTSLAAVNNVYGCEYAEVGGYTMESWSVVTKSDAEDKWGFEAPEAILGKTEEELMAALVIGYTELSDKPSNWSTEAF